MELKQYLKTNCHWENRVIISPNELVAIILKQTTNRLQVDRFPYLFLQSGISVSKSGCAF